MKKSATKVLWWVGIGLTLSGILGFSIWKKNADETADKAIQRIINVKLVDVSESASKYKSSIQEQCTQNIEQLKEGDIFISGKFAANVSSQAHIVKDTDELEQKCSNAATVPADFLPIKGTSLPLALRRIQTEINLQRNKGINYPVAITLLIHAAEPLEGEAEYDFESIKEDIQNMVEKDNIFLAFIGANTKLQGKLKTSLQDVKNISFCSFEEHESCTQNVIQTTRKVKPVTLSQGSALDYQSTSK